MEALQVRWDPSPAYGGLRMTPSVRAIGRSITLPLSLKERGPGWAVGGEKPRP